MVRFRSKCSFAQLRNSTSGSPSAPTGQNELCLSALAVRRNHQAACHLVGNLRAEVTPDNMHAEIEPRSTARRTQDIPIIDVENVGIDGQLRILAREMFGSTDN